MIRRKDIIKELTSRGYKVEAHESIKNRVELKGIRFMTESGICPVVYTDNIIEDADSLMEAVETVLKTYNNIENIEVDKDSLTDPAFILENLYIGLQKTSIEDIVKLDTDFEGIEKYLYVRINEDASFKLTCVLLKTLKVDESEMWKAANKNTFAKTSIKSMSEKLSELAGIKIEEIEGMPIQYIVTNTMNYRGASAILDIDSLKKLGQKLNTHRFIMLPSSIHEMIVIPDDGNGNIEEFNAMVQEVNETQVDPEERLTDRAYVIEV